jgi:hypothetical protein
MEISEELKKINNRLDKLEELHRLVHDLLIEYITIKTVKIPNNLDISNNEIQTSSSSSTDNQQTTIIKKTTLKKKCVLSTEEVKFKLNHEEVDNCYYLEFNTKNYSNIEEKLSDTSANNKVNVYKYLYVHFDDIRTKIINKLDCSEYLKELYETSVNQKKYKDITELLKNECIEIHKNYKDKDEFKKLLIELKKDYDKILQKIA